MLTLSTLCTARQGLPNAVALVKRIVRMHRNGDRYDHEIDSALERELCGIKSYDLIEEYRKWCRRHGVEYAFSV
jgi:hypothetical protein